MGAQNPKRKGNAFERTIAKDLSLWVSNGKDDAIFIRRQGSGGALRDKQGRSGAGGDIHADKPEGFWLVDKLSFELKFYQDLRSDFWKLSAEEKSKFDDFMRQAEEDATHYGKDWVLVVKSNRLPVMCITNSNSISSCFNFTETWLNKNERWIFPWKKIMGLNPNQLKKRLTIIKGGNDAS